MGRGDWTSSAAYEDLRSLDGPGFAWEFLDRNPDFTRERRRLERAVRRNALDPAEVNVFTRRWGLRFCRPHKPEQRRCCFMDAARPAKRDHTDGTAG